MSISDKAQALIDELVAACIAFGRQDDKWIPEVQE